MLRIIAEGRSFHSYGCRNKEEEVVSPTVDNSSSPLPGVPPASGTAAQQKPLSCPGTQGPTAGAGTSWGGSAT